MKVIVTILMLFVAVSTLSAELAWQEPVEVFRYANLNKGNHSFLTSDGCHLLVWTENDLEDYNFRISLFDQQYQAMWDEPLIFPYSPDDIVETTDSCYVMVFIYSNYKTYNCMAQKVSRTGELLWSPMVMAIPRVDFNNTLKAEADHNGGLYIVCSNSSDNCTIQHLNSAGQRTMQSTGLILGGNQDSRYSTILVMPDDSVIVTWSLPSMLYMQRVNITGQFLWPQAISVETAGNFSYSFLCAFNDDSFALIMSYGYGRKVQRYNHSGVALWPNPLILPSDREYGGNMFDPALGSDNTIFFIGSNLYKITADGISVYGDGIDLGQWFYDYDYSQPIPDDAGGCTVFGGWSNSYFIYALHVNATGTHELHTIYNSQNTMDMVSAERYGNQISIDWIEDDIYTNLTSRIKAQIVNQQFEPQLGNNGIDVVWGYNGQIRNQKISARANGCAVLWEGRTTQDDLYIQIYLTNGQALFDAAGQRINSQNSFIIGQSLIHSKDNTTMVVWRQQLNGIVSNRYQVFDALGDNMFPEGGIEIDAAGTDMDWRNISTIMDEWVLLGVQSGCIWACKAGQSTFTWNNCVQITQPSSSSVIENVRLEWPWLKWKTGAPQSYPRFACLDSELMICPGFPNNGLGLIESFDDRVLSQAVFTAWGDNLHVVTRYMSSDYYYYDYQTAFNRQGQQLYDYLYIVNDYYTGFCSFVRNDRICIATVNSEDFIVREYNSSGELLDVHTYQAEWFDYSSSWSAYGITTLSNGDIMIIARVRVDGIDSSLTRHIYITPQWQIIVPEDSNILIRDVYPTVSVLGDRAWLIFNDQDTLILQGVKAEGLSTEDPEAQVVSLPVLNSCIPNPFNPSTTVSFTLPESGHTTIGVYDLRGRNIATILNDYMTEGTHSIVWNGKDTEGIEAASGIYFLRLNSGGKQHTRKVTLIK